MMSVLQFYALIFAAAASAGGRYFTAAAPPPAMYVFGDSLFDSGNNNYLPTIAKANYLPYGTNFPGGPTGRFTNGRTVVDFLAEYLGLPYAPPVTPGTMFQTRPTGLNYASASCGILFETGKSLGGCVSLGDQVSWFQATVTFHLPKFFPTKEALMNHLSTSLFPISIGSNDYLINYLQSPTAGWIPTPEIFAAKLVTEYSVQLQRLYDMGARRLVVFELGPLGCIPSITRKNLRRKEKCVETVNGYALTFNQQLTQMIQGFTFTHPDCTMIHGRIFQLAYDGIKHPSSYGLGDVSTACCITWANGTSGCIPGLIPCQDTSRSYFWDGFHLTEAVYKGVAEKCFSDPSVCSPKSIKQLIS